MRNIEDELHELMSHCAGDPLMFVRVAYPWGVEGGPLEAYEGPDRWQADILSEIGRQVRERGCDGVNAVLPIRVAVSSGCGVGKGALTAWIVNWIMSTRRNAIGTVTANTNDQLSEKTWAAIRTWTTRCVTAHWFEINSQVLYRKGYRESWKCTPASCAAENSEAFQGQHNASSTSFIVFDEASGIDEAIFKAAEGGLTDGEPMMSAAQKCPSSPNSSRCCPLRGARRSIGNCHARRRTNATARTWPFLLPPVASCAPHGSLTRGRGPRTIGGVADARERAHDS
jgi:hypothetical protein